MIIQYPQNLVAYKGIERIVELNEEDPEDRSLALNLVLGFTRRQRFRRAIKANGKRWNLEKDAVLISHGKAAGRKKAKVWKYYDKTRSKRESVQDWIDSVDGKYRVLFLHVCNGGDLEIKSERSIVIHARRNFSLGDLLHNTVRMRIYVPEMGYVENNYRELRKGFRIRS
jgi:hypothetical protein